MEIVPSSFLVTPLICAIPDDVYVGSNRLINYSLPSVLRPFKTTWYPSGANTDQGKPSLIPAFVPASSIPDYPPERISLIFRPFDCNP